MKLVWLPAEDGDRRYCRYCLFLIKEDGVRIKIIDPKYSENGVTGKEVGYELQ